MTTRERQVFEAILNSPEGKLHPSTIGKIMGISGDYAEQICRDMVYYRILEKVGLYFRIKESYLKKMARRK